MKKLKNFIPDIERYFQEDCYCPNEVYSVDGFGFQYVYADNEAVIKALNMYGRVPETWELLKEIERINKKVLKKLIGEII